MSSYWISDDWAVQVKTLESYLSDAMRNGAIDHLIRANKDEDGTISFYIHPANQNGETIDYKVDDNQVYPADPHFNKPDELLTLFMRGHKGDTHMFVGGSLSAYISCLEKLRQAVEKHDDAKVAEILETLHDADDEFDEDGGDET